MGLNPAWGASLLYPPIHANLRKLVFAIGGHILTKGLSKKFLVDEETLGLLRLLLARLERITADSVWAHRASGVRGALLEAVDALQRKDDPNLHGLDELIQSAFAILSEAAKEKLR